MKPQDFRMLLVGASFLALRFAKQYVIDHLPIETFLYRVELNQSHDDGCDAEFVTYPEDRDRMVEGLTEEQVVALLVRRERCPAWIDIAVCSANDAATAFGLSCCGRFTHDRSRMYYDDRGQGPFGIKSPTLPAGYVEGTRFRLSRR